MSGGAGGSPGFTVVHLALTVAVLAVVGLTAGAGCKRAVERARTGEAASMIATIKGAEESYRAETLRYLDVSRGDIDRYFPTSPPINGKVPWEMSSCSADPCKGFETLNVKPAFQVVYRYSVVAGPADGQPKSLDGQVFGTANEPWFVVKARGDTNQDGVDGFFWSSSWSNYIWSRNPGE